MKEKTDFLILRGDRRQNLLCELLIGEGHNAQMVSGPETWGRENLPAPGAFVITAKADRILREASHDYGFCLIEYGSMPFFKEENGAITAEGAVQIAMKHRLRTVRGSEALVIGWGGIGRPLAALLKALGCHTVTVAVRREEQLWVLKGEGYRPLLSKDIEDHAEQYDLIFNTAPELILTRPVLEQLRPGALVVDLASKPGGTDWDSAKALGVKAVHALALPGHLTPMSGAVAIRNAVYRLCEEEHHAR